MGSPVDARKARCAGLDRLEPRFRFLRAVEASLAKVERTPELYAAVDQATRRAWVRRFPFAVYYEIEYKRIVIYVVSHYGRDPTEWQQRSR